MSSSDIAVSVRGLSKSYTIAHNAKDRATTLAEAVARRIRSPFKREEQETFWALNDVSFDVQRGDVVGVIGRNGAGKSTLFKVLSRITEPTGGEVDLHGRVGSLLEVGTGFSGELSGRENIYLNGTILGMRRAEIAKRFDEIVDFAGVEKFLDTPVKRYSSGMYVRLAFAVAAHLETNILMIDEVLAVGDQEFQTKCLSKIKDVAQSGRTVMFVSHSMTSVSQLCTSALFLKQGRCLFAGSTAEAVQLYLQQPTQDDRSDWESAKRRPGSGEYRFRRVYPSNSMFDGDGEKTIRFEIERIGERLANLYLSAHVRNEAGIVLAQYDSRLLGAAFPDLTGKDGQLTFTTPWLKPGRYWMDLGICGAGLIDLYESCCVFDVAPRLPYTATVPPDAYQYGAVLGDFSWSIGDVNKNMASPLVHA